MNTRSENLFARSHRRLPGGVNSPVRAFRGVGGTPVFMARGEGAQLFDADDNAYTDYICSWGAVIVGHAHPAVVQAVTDTATRGLGFGAPTELECHFAETLATMLPSLEMSRAVNSGTEATMTALRIARGYTGRDRIVKFDGCYHGHSDSLLVAAGSGALTLGIPSSAGVPHHAVTDTVVLPYNDVQAVADYFATHGDKTAAVIVEPIAGNMNMVRGTTEFLTTLQTACKRHGSVLIFDEVMTGFRVAAGGAQALTGITPDLTCLGKVVGGGLGVAVVGGREDIMRQLAPLGGVYQAGTLAGNPVALAAGLATLELVAADGFYARLERLGKRLCVGLQAAAASAGVEFSMQSAGGMFGFYFRPTVPDGLMTITETSAEMKNFRAFFHAMLARGVYFAPSIFEAGFFGAAHDETIIEDTITKAKEVFCSLDSIQ